MAGDNRRADDFARAAAAMDDSEALILAVEHSPIDVLQLLAIAVDGDSLPSSGIGSQTNVSHLRIGVSTPGHHHAAKPLAAKEKRVLNTRPGHGVRRMRELMAADDVPGGIHARIARL